MRPVSRNSFTHWRKLVCATPISAMTAGVTRRSSSSSRFWIRSTPQASSPSFGQADHPAAALQRMELPAHGDERFAIARIVLEHAAMLVDGVENFVGFGQVDVEQFRVEAARVGLEQPLRFLRDRRRRGRTRLDDQIHARRERRAFAAAVDFLQRRVGLRDELAVADQVGVIAKARELAAQLAACRRIGGRIADVRHQPRQRGAQFCHRVFDRLRFARRPAAALRRAASQSAAR